MKVIKILFCLILCFYMMFVPILTSYAATYLPATGGIGTGIRLLNKNDGKEIQKKLKGLGYYNGKIDGNFGSSRKALNHLFEDQGFVNGKGKLRVFSSGHDWDDLNEFDLENIMDVSEKGLIKMPREENDKTLIGSIKLCKAYTAAHGFKYCYCNGGRINMNKSEREDCVRHNISSSDRKYVTDCSRGVSASIFEYAKANNNQKMMERFKTENHSIEYWQIAYNLQKGGTDEYFRLVKNIKNIKPGDIIVTKTHVEFYAGKEKGKIMVWNWGNNSAIATPEATESFTNLNHEDTFILRLKGV